MTRWLRTLTTFIAAGSMGFVGLVTASLPAAAVFNVANISGYVLDQDGVPVAVPPGAGAIVIGLYTASGTLVTQTDSYSDGSYVLTASPVTSGEYYINAHFTTAMPFEDTDFPGHNPDGSIATFHLDPGDSYTLDIYAYRFPSVSGTVDVWQSFSDCLYDVGLLDVRTGHVLERKDIVPFANSYFLSTEGLTRGLYTVVLECRYAYADGSTIYTPVLYYGGSRTLRDAATFLLCDSESAAGKDFSAQNLPFLDHGAFFLGAGWDADGGPRNVVVRDDQGEVRQFGAWTPTSLGDPSWWTLPAGDYVVEVTGPGFATSTVSFATGDTFVDIPSQVGYAVTGTVSSAGQPASDAIVSLVRTSDWNVYQPGVGFVPWVDPELPFTDVGHVQSGPVSVGGTVATDASGHFTIPDVPDGDSYTLYIDSQAVGSAAVFLGGSPRRDTAATFAVHADLGFGAIAIPASGVVSGRITWTSATAPKRYLVPMAFAWSAATSTWDLVQVAVYSHDDADPSYVDYNLALPAGTYRIAMANVSDGFYWEPGLAAEVFYNVMDFDSATAVTVTGTAHVTGKNFLLSTLPPVASTRFAGADRYATAVEVSKTFAPGVPVVYVASGEAFPDALAAAPAAAAQGAPLLTVRKNELPSVVAAELARLNPVSIVVVGGEASVSPAVYDQLAGYAGAGGIRRVFGADRYATARAIVADYWGASGATMVYLASGRNFPDALSAAAAAGASGIPVITVDGQSPLPAETVSLMGDLGASTVVIAGGTASISNTVEAQVQGLSDVTTVTRRSGANRYLTGAEINYYAFPGATTAYIANGTNFPDALAGAAIAGKEGAPLYIVPGTCIPSFVVADLTSKNIRRVNILGGAAAVSVDLTNAAVC